MSSTSAPRRIRHSKATDPQREFWGSDAKFRLFVGGVGSGKTRGGAVEALRMPPGSTGAIVAPTYPMLRDATLRTFIELVDRAGILKAFNKSEKVATLSGRRTILFRSGDNPDRLRGPNLGWFWLDEAAMMKEFVWKIMIGRLREMPARGWATTTPRGKNWLYKTLADKPGDPRYKVVRASSTTNPFLPIDFVQTLIDSYDDAFAAQEVGGEFLEDMLGQLFPEFWVDRLFSLAAPTRRHGDRWLTADLGEGTGRDSTAIFVGDFDGILHGEESNQVGIPEAAHRIAQLHVQWGIPEDRLVYDANGRGKDLPRYLEQHDIYAAVGYKGSFSGGNHFANRRSKMGWRLRQRLDPERPKPVPALRHDEERSVFDPTPELYTGEKQAPFTLPADKPWWPRLAEELKALRYYHHGKKIALENKDLMASRLGRSPDLVDALLMRFCLDDDEE